MDDHTPAGWPTARPRAPLRPLLEFESFRTTTF